MAYFCKSNFSHRLAIAIDLNRRVLQLGLQSLTLSVLNVTSDCALLLSFEREDSEFGMSIGEHLMKNAHVMTAIFSGL